MSEWLPLLIASLVIAGVTLLAIRFSRKLPCNPACGVSCGPRKGGKPDCGEPMLPGPALEALFAVAGVPAPSLPHTLPLSAWPSLASQLPGRICPAEPEAVKAELLRQGFDPAALALTGHLPEDLKEINNLCAGRCEIRVEFPVPGQPLALLILPLSAWPVIDAEHTLCRLYPKF
ncbi:MAG: hypothetical protein RL095_4216 [Verrucomicrobiota bacterium]|jgi:hypothetical protein